MCMGYLRNYIRFFLKLRSKRSWLTMIYLHRIFIKLTKLSVIFLELFNVLNMKTLWHHITHIPHCPIVPKYRTLCDMWHVSALSLPHNLPLSAMPYFLGSLTDCWTCVCRRSFWVFAKITAQWVQKATIMYRKLRYVYVSVCVCGQTTKSCRHNRQ